MTATFLKESTMKKKACVSLSILLVFGIAAFLASCDLVEPAEPAKTPVAGDYTYAKMNQTAGSVTAVTITAKSDKSPGAVSNIKYNNSATIPQAAGTYPVTFDVAEASGWNAASGLSAGNLVVTEAASDNETPVRSDYIINRLGQTVGSVQAVQITPKSGKSTGAITIYYQGTTYAKTTNVPHEAGTYTVTFDVAAAPGWDAATGLAAGSLIIYPAGENDKTPVASDFTIGNLGQTVGSVTAVTITPKSTASTGAITIFYASTVYPRSTTVPSAAGTYAVTFDVEAVQGWKMAAGLSAGNLTINAVGDTAKTPVAGDYTFDNLNQTAGSVTVVTITRASNDNTITSPGAVTIKYNNNTTIPQSAGTYPVTFDVAAASPDWKAATGLSAGNLVVTANDNETPVASDYIISKLGQSFGSVTAVSIMPKSEKSTGAITIYYEGTGYGKTTILPTAIGSYTVTFNVAAAAGWNAASGLSAGTLTINAAVPPLACDCIFKIHYGDEECCSGGVEAPDCTCEKNMPIVVPPPEPCLHNGKEYLPGDHQELPMGEGCTCTNVPGTVSQYCDRPITNRELLGVAEFDAVVAIINEKILEWKDDDDTYLGKLIDNIEEIKVTSENGNSQYNSTTRVITVRAGDLEDVEDSFGIALNNAVNAVLGRHIGHDTKDIIRLAMHGDKPV